MTAPTELTEDDFCRLPGGPTLGVPAAIIDGDDQAWEVHVRPHPASDLVSVLLVGTRPMAPLELVAQWAADRFTTSRTHAAEAIRILAVSGRV